MAKIAGITQRERGGRGGVSNDVKSSAKFS